MIIDTVKSLIGISGFSREDYGFLFIYLVAFVPLVYKFFSPFFILAGGGDFTILINPVIMISGLLLLKRKLGIYVRLSDILTYFVVVVLLLLTPLLFPANQPFFERYYADFVLFTMSFYFIGLTLDFSKREKIISAVARIGFLYSVYWQTLVFLGFVQTNYGYDGTAGEQMGQAYYLLFSVMVFFVSLIRRFSLINLAYFVASTLLLLFFGTRGPVLILGLFVAVYLIVFHKFKSVNFIKKVGAVVLLFSFLYYMEIIVMAIIPLASALGFSTRVFDSILENRMINMTESSDRDMIWEKLIDAIQYDQGSIGYGWLGDRLLLAEAQYSHNFELEILTQFGIYIGGFMLLLLFVLIVRSYLGIKNTSSKDFWLVMLFVGFVELQLSKTYIEHSLFFMMIGYYISINRKVCA